MTSLPQPPPNDNTPEAGDYGGGGLTKFELITQLEGRLIPTPGGDWLPVRDGQYQTRYGVFRLIDHSAGTLEVMLRQSRPIDLAPPAGLGDQCDGHHPNGSKLSQCQNEATIRIVYINGVESKCAKRCQACADAFTAQHHILRQEAL